MAPVRANHSGGTVAAGAGYHKNRVRTCDSGHQVASEDRLWQREIMPKRRNPARAFGAVAGLYLSKSRVPGGSDGFSSPNFYTPMPDGDQQSLTADQIRAIRATISSSRFATYFKAAGHDEERALRLYLWNAQLGEAFHVLRRRANRPSPAAAQHRNYSERALASPRRTPMRSG